MVWLFVGLGVLVVSITIYYLFPLFKKLASRPKKEKKEKHKKTKKTESNNPTVITNPGGLFESKEDPDTKVNEENLEIKELFEEKPKNYFEESDDSDLTINQDFDDLFGSEYIPSKSLRTDDNSSFDFVSDGSVDGDDEEIKDFLEELKRTSLTKKTSLAEEINELPPVIKALMISDLFDKKDI